MTKLECEGIVRLLNSGISLIECIKILRPNEEDYLVQDMLKSLENGVPIEQYFYKYLDKGFQNHFLAFIQFLPFHNAMKLSLSLESYDLQSRIKFIKNIASPLIMLVGCLLGIQLFTFYCFPSLISLMNDFDVNVVLFEVSTLILKYTISILVVVFVLVCLIMCYFIQPSKIVLGYVLLMHTPWHNTFCHFASGQFAYYFNECTKMGYKTQATLSMLQKIQSKPLIVFLSYHIEKRLLGGMSFDSAIGNLYIEKSLKKFMQIAMHSSCLEEMLESYIEQNTHKGIEICMKWSKRITLFTYSSIGILVILVYQVLLLPLSIIQEM